VLDTTNIPIARNPMSVRAAMIASNNDTTIVGDSIPIPAIVHDRNTPTRKIMTANSHLIVPGFISD
jgi:hypothetical protein